MAGSHHATQQRGRLVKVVAVLGEQRLGDQHHGVQTDHVAEFERAHRVGGTQFHAVVYVGGGGMAVGVHPHGGVQVGH